MAKKKLTKQQIKDKAKAAAKRMTLGKMNKAIALIGPIGNNALRLAEGDGDQNNLAQRISRDQTGFDFTDGTFDANRLVRGYGGAVFNKIERWIFRGAGVPFPSVRRKGMGSKIGAGIYYANSIGKAAAGTTNSQRFRGYYHAQYGVKLSESGMDALDYSEPIVKKIIPYVIVNKIIQWVK